MTRQRSVHEILGRLADVEDRFLKSEFLAPVMRGRRIRVRIGDVVCTMRTEPESFEGWGVFRPRSHTVARYVREATLRERRSYLDCLPLVRMLLCRRANGGWLAVPAESGLQFVIEGTPCVRLVESGEAFQTVRVRFDGANFWFDSVESRQDPTLAGWLRDALQKEVPADELQRAGLTSVMRRAYATELERRREKDRVERHDRVESRLRHALQHSGANLQGFVEHADGYRVTWDAGGRRHVSSIDRDDLTVQVAGICLSGEDRKFDRGSLVGVVQEAERSHAVFRVGHDNGGIAENEYWDIHPRV